MIADCPIQRSEVELLIHRNSIEEESDECNTLTAVDHSATNKADMGMRIDTGNAEAAENGLESGPKSSSSGEVRPAISPRPPSQQYHHHRRRPLLMLFQSNETSVVGGQQTVCAWVGEDQFLITQAIF